MLYIDKTNKTPIYEQVYFQLIDSIISDPLAPGSVLPATRKLSEELSISRNTVQSVSSTSGRRLHSAKGRQWFHHKSDSRGYGPRSKPKPLRTCAAADSFPLRF
ncbi:GntR family transcriptional regulator [Clostridiales bacterium]|nr:GntR family transcriptional regulator [Clostridiales bacterium]